MTAVLLDPLDVPNEHLRLALLEQRAACVLRTPDHDRALKVGRTLAPSVITPIGDDWAVIQLKKTR